VKTQTLILPKLQLGVTGTLHHGNRFNGFRIDAIGLVLGTL